MEFPLFPEPIFIKHLFSQEEATQLHGKLVNYVVPGNVGVGTQPGIAPGAVYVVNYLPAVRAHIKLIPEVSRLVGADVLPTFCMAQAYKKGAELLPHLDRHNCEVSLTVAFTPDATWDIHTILGESRQTFSMGCGDALLFSGAKTTHYRHPLELDAYLQVAFHFVLADGERAHLFYDRVNIKE